MSKRLVFFSSLLVSAIFLALPQCSAFAEDAQDPVVPCVGPMCVLTPIYKLGTMMPDMPAMLVKPAAPPPAAISPAPPPRAESGSPTPDAASAAGTTSEGNPNQADTRRTASGDAVDRHAAPTSTSSPSTSPRRPARRATAYRSTPRRARVASRAVRQPRRDGADATVTIAANGTEIDRLLRLASVVKAPPIQVIPAVAFVDGCRQKPADFVVDTMANPERRGPAIPLFTESLIVVARKDIHDFADLRGRQVSFGLAGGSSQRVAGRVFRSLGIDVHEVPLDLDNALDGLAQGDLDAVALLAPRGFDRLARHDPQLHLLALPDRMSPPDGLKLSRIDPSSYLGGTWSAPSLGVVTVDAVLSPNQAAQMQPNAQAVYAALDRRSQELAANGFDLIGGNGGLTTMRSSARDVAPEALARQPAGSGC